MEFLKRFAKSRLFKEVLAVVAAALAGYASSGCGVQAPRSPSQDVIACRVAVLAPVLGDLAGDAVLQISGGALDPMQLLIGLGLEPDAIIELARRYHACAPPTPPSSPEPVKTIRA